MHALNMIVGEPCLSKESMDQACERLSPSSTSLMQGNPHSGLFGNYDVNVALYILQIQWGFEANYFDSRKDAKEIFEIQNLCGLLLNVPGIFHLNRHWISYKTFDYCWYRLDSKESKAVLIEDVLEEIKCHLKQGDTIIVISKIT
jgi:hypothetical protein